MKNYKRYNKKIICNLWKYTVNFDNVAFYKVMR